MSVALCAHAAEAGSSGIETTPLGVCPMKKSLLRKASLLAVPAVLAAGLAGGSMAQTSISAKKCYKLVLTPV